MWKKPFKRLRRKGRPSSEEVARDREICRKVMEEFPPLEPKPEVPILNEPFREAIKSSGKSIRRLAQQAKVSDVVLQQFMVGERDLRLATAERLARVLKLKLVSA